MTLVVHHNVAGQVRGAPIRLSGRRRRLSTIVKAQAPAGRRILVSVHRGGDPLVVTDPSVRFRTRAAARRAGGRTWAETLVGPGDTVLITLLPLGGRGGGSGGSKAGLGLSLAAVALLAAAPWAAPAIAAAIGASTVAVQAGLVIGGVALAYAAQRASAAKKTATDNTQVYSITGGGNLARKGERRPWQYGRYVSTPPLTQKDYFLYTGIDTVLFKRMTLGIGKFQVHEVFVGEASFWKEGSGLQPPFNTDVDPSYGAAIEFLYEQPSQISNGDVIGSDAVAGQQLPRAGANPSTTPWFRLTPPGVTAGKVLLNYSWPQILNSTSSTPLPADGDVAFEAQRLDETTGAPYGPIVLIHRQTVRTYTQIVFHGSAIVDLPQVTAWQVRGTNAAPKLTSAINEVTWDLMAAIKPDLHIRPKTTEIVMRIRSGAGLTVTDYGNVRVDATAIIPVWTGSAWVEQATRKCVHAYVDAIRAEHGLADPDGADLAKALYTANRTDLVGRDTFDGQIEGAPSWWEAASEILLPLRAEPVKLGRVHSFVRDEPAELPRHILSRRQIVRNSSQATYKLAVTDGGDDVIVEFAWHGDPARTDEVRYSVGPRTRTPKRYKIKGISDGAHALEYATYLAAIACFRGNERKITTEWDGRLVVPGDRILSDLWYLQGATAYGVAHADGRMLALDAVADLPDDWTYASIRNRVGREWGGVLRVRGRGRRGLELHAGDVASLTAATGLGLGDVLARDHQDPTTIVVGALAELQRTYVARAAVPSDRHHVEIEMVRDDPRVWQLLGEAAVIPQPPGSNDNLTLPLRPTITAAHARCERIETAIELVWHVTPARGATGYQAQISYDGVSFEPVENGGGQLTAGRAAMRQSSLPVTFRARGIGTTGLPGEWISVTFTTITPSVDGALLVPQSVDIDALLQNVQDLLGDDPTKPGSIGEAKASAAAARARADEVQAHLDAAGTELAGSIQSLSGTLSAAIVAEASTRDTADAAATSRIDGALSRIGASEGLIASEATTRASQIEAVTAEVTLAQSSVAGVSASLAAEATTRATETGGLATRTTGLESLMVSTIDSVYANTARIATEESARVAADSASTSQLAAAVSRIGGAEASIVAEATTRASETGGLATRTTGLESLMVSTIGSVYANTARIATEESTRASETGSLASRASALEATQGALQASVSTVEQAQVADRTATASSIAQVLARADDGTASGQMAWTAVAAPTGFYAAFALTLKANGAEAGLRMLVRSDGTTVMVLSASNFLFQDPNVAGGAPQTLLSYSASEGAFVYSVPVKLGRTNLAAGAASQPFGKIFAGGVSPDPYIDLPANANPSFVGYFAVPGADVYLVADHAQLLRASFTGAILTIGTPTSPTTIDLTLALYLTGPSGFSKLQPIQSVTIPRAFGVTNNGPISQYYEVVVPAGTYRAQLVYGYRTTNSSGSFALTLNSSFTAAMWT